VSLRHAIAAVISTLLFAAVMVLVHRYVQFFYHESRWVVTRLR
jgi:hypothetical protein